VTGENAVKRRSANNENSDFESGNGGSGHGSGRRVSQRTGRGSMSSGDQYHHETLTFDDLSPGEFSIPITNGYGGMQWNNFGVVAGAIGNGYQTGTVSPPNVAFNESGSPASISFTGTFTLKSAYLTSPTPINKCEP